MPRATSSPTRGKCQPHTCSKKQRARGHTAFRSGFPRAVADLETTNAAFVGRRKPCPVKAVCFYIKHEQNSNYAFRCVGNGFHQRSGNKALDSLKRHFTRRHKDCLCLSWRHIRRIVKWRRGKTDYEQSGIRHIARVVQGREIHSLFLRPSRRIRCISHLLQRRNSQTSHHPFGRRNGGSLSSRRTNTLSLILYAYCGGRCLSRSVHTGVFRGHCGIAPQEILRTVHVKYIGKRKRRGVVSRPKGNGRHMAQTPHITSNTRHLAYEP